MKPHTRKLYQIVRAKLHLGEQDGIYEEEGHISGDFVIRAFDKMERELIRWMFILWIGQVSYYLYDYISTGKKLIIIGLFSYRIDPSSLFL